MKTIASYLISAESLQKWKPSMGTLPVGTKVKYRGQNGVVSDDATSDDYSIIKINGREITTHNDDLMIIPRREPKPKRR